MFWDLFCRVFDFEVHVFAVNLLTETTAEESVVNLPANIEQNRYRDDDHVSLSLSGGFVPPWKTTTHKTPNHCLAVVESKPPLPHIPLLTTISPGQAQDAWWFRQLEKFAEILRISLWLLHWR